MNTPEWIKYDGSDEQLLEIMHAPRGYKYRNNKGYESGILIACGSLINLCNELQDDSVTHYLICQPHPYADLIKIWADTGCPVWVRPTKPYEFKISDYLNHPTTRLMVDGKGVYLITTTPDWNIPGEYRLTPFND